MGTSQRTAGWRLIYPPADKETSTHAELAFVVVMPREGYKYRLHTRNGWQSATLQKWAAVLEPRSQVIGVPDKWDGAIRDVMEEEVTAEVSDRIVEVLRRIHTVLECDHEFVKTTEEYEVGYNSADGPVPPEYVQGPDRCWKCGKERREAEVSHG